MPHENGKIRVKRTGSGHLNVTIDPEDEGVGKARSTIYFVRRRDSKKDPDPGDAFVFDQTQPLVFEAGAPFNVSDIRPNKVTVQYAGAPGADQQWKVHIYVVDQNDQGDEGGRPIVSDGSATIKNK